MSQKRHIAFAANFLQKFPKTYRRIVIGGFNKEKRRLEMVRCEGHNVILSQSSHEETVNHVLCSKVNGVSDAWF